MNRDTFGKINLVKIVVGLEKVLVKRRKRNVRKKDTVNGKKVAFYCRVQCATVNKGPCKKKE